MPDIEEAKQSSYDALRVQYREYLQGLGLSKNTIQTAFSDAFYLWRKASPQAFWSAVEAENFDETAKELLLDALKKNTTGEANSLVNEYLSQLRRFRSYVMEGKGTTEVAMPSVTKGIKFNIPKPSPEQVEHYLHAWDENENYHLQEDALNKLFFSLCPGNTDLSDILIKTSTLNDFYSTNIFSVFPVAKHIQELNIDARLKAGDVTLVADIQKVTISGVEKNFYSFATKYCSHHNPRVYPIYDYYVERVLCYFRNRDGFSIFKNEDLKNYVVFIDILNAFRLFYSLDDYDLKQIDQYIWQLGKEYFPIKYGKRK